MQVALLSALLATTNTPALYSHCIQWADDDGVCFVEVLDASGQAHLRVTQAAYDQLLSVPWDPNTAVTIDVVSPADYAAAERAVTYRYRYDVSELSSAILTIDVLDGDGAAIEFLDNARVMLDEPEASRDFGGDQILDAELRNKNGGSLVGYDESKCTRAILVGAVKGASQGAGWGARIGQYLPTPAPGGGAIAGGAMGASVGFVLGAIVAQQTSPKCEKEQPKTDVTTGSTDDGATDDDPKADDKPKTGTTVDDTAGGSGHNDPITWNTAGQIELPLADQASDDPHPIETGELKGNAGVVDTDGSPKDDDLHLRVTEESLLIDPLRNLAGLRVRVGIMQQH